MVSSPNFAVHLYRSKDGCCLLRQHLYGEWQTYTPGIGWEDSGWDELEAPDNYTLIANCVVFKCSP